jgi:hypothetical protein
LGKPEALRLNPGQGNSFKPPSAFATIKTTKEVVPMARMDEMIAAVKNYAIEHYNEDGWDSIVECYDDSDIKEDIGNAATVEEAIRNVARFCILWDERRTDALAEVF